MPQPVTQQTYQKQAIALLKEALYSQGRYSFDPQYKNSINIEQESTNIEQVKNLINQLAVSLEELFNLEQKYKDKRATQDWATYLKDSLKSSPEYEKYTQEKTTFETQITSLKKQYIELSTKNTAEHIAKELNITTDTTKLTDLIFEQVKYMEQNLGVYLSTQKYGDNTYPEIVQQEKKRQEKYQDFLQDNKVIDTLLSNIKGYQTLIANYPNKPEIIKLIEQYKTIYAEKIFFSVNKQLYKTTNTNNLNFFKDELEKTNIKESIFLQKFALLCRHTLFDEKELKTERKLTPTITTALDKILSKINDLTYPQISNFSEKANETFTSIATPTGRDQFLSPTQNTAFHNELLFIEYQKFLNNIENVDKKYIDKESQELLAKRIKELETTTKTTIEIATEEARNNYTPPPQTIKTPPPQPQPSVQQITGFTFEAKPISTKPINQIANNKSSISQEKIAYIQKQALENANEIYTNILGINLLLEEEKSRFIQQLASLEEGSLMEYVNQNTIVTIAIWLKSKVVQETILPKQEKIKEQIKLSIHKKFATKKAEKIVRFKNEIYKTAEIIPVQLRQDLEEELENAIINLKKLGSGIPPIPSFTDKEKDTNKTDEAILKTREAYIIDKIEIAKLLSKIETFNNVPTDQQKQFIQQLHDILSKIKQNNKLLETLEPQLTQDSSKKTEIKQLKNNISTFKNEINEIIIKINLYTPKLTTIKEELSIKDNNSKQSSYISKNLLNAALTYLGAAIATLSIGVFIYNIPLVGNLIKPIVNALSFSVNALGITAGVAAITTAGAYVGKKLHLQELVFKPFTYVLNEIYDIWSKEKSYIDRIFRTAAILLPIAAGLALLGVAVSNPVSGPVLATIVIGGLAATFISSSVFAYVAKRISQAVCTRFYDIQDPDLYKKELALSFCNNDLQEANKLREFFVKNINEYQKKLNKLSAKEKRSEHGELTQEILSSLKNNWNSITQNKDPDSYATDADKLLTMLYKDKEYDLKKQLQTNIEQSQNITNSLLEIIEIPTYIRSTKEMNNNEKTNELFARQYKSQISFEPLATTLNETIRNQPSEPLQLLNDFHAIIIKNKNRKSIVSSTN